MYDVASSVRGSCDYENSNHQISCIYRTTQCFFYETLAFLNILFSRAIPRAPHVFCSRYCFNISLDLLNLSLIKYKEMTIGFVVITWSSHCIWSVDTDKLTTRIKLSTKFSKYSEKAAVRDFRLTPVNTFL